jgi:RNA polymerase sigma-70 factor (ECF subfamily)
MARAPHFLAARSAGEPIDVGELERLLEAAEAAGHAAWPGVEVDGARFARFLAERIPADAPAVQALRTLHCEDLYLACGCALGETRALRALEQHLRREIGSYLSAVDREPAFVDEVGQTLREKLLIPKDGAAPRIVEYTGRGALGAWLRAVAVRTAIDLRRASPKVQTRSENAADEPKVGAVDPEIDFLKVRYMDDFREAFAATLASLGRDQRNVLRLHYVDGMSVAEIGTSYRVHRSTVARWIAEAREQILAETRQRLAARLNVGSQEVDTLLGMLHSQLDLTLSRMFKDDESE